MSTLLETLKEILQQRQAADMQEGIRGGWQPGMDLPAQPSAQMPAPNIPRNSNAVVGRPNPETMLERDRLSQLDSQMSQMDAPKQPEGFWMGLLKNSAQGLAYGDKLPQMRVQQGQLERQKRMDLAAEADRIRQGVSQRRQEQFQGEAADRAQAQEERAAAAFPTEQRMAEAQIAKLEAPPPAVQPREIEVFTNSEGKRVVVRQMPDGTLKAEPQGDVQGPQKIPGRDVPLPKDVVDQKIYMDRQTATPPAPRNVDPLSPEGIEAQRKINEDREKAKTVGAGGVASPYSIERAKRTVESINNLASKVSGWTVGAGSLFDAIPASDARNFKAELDTLKANIAFNELAAMREASKTGGALGAVSERELTLLQSALGALDTGQSKENFAKNLAAAKASVERWQEEIAKVGQQPKDDGNAPPKNRTRIKL